MPEEVKERGGVIQDRLYRSRKSYRELGQMLGHW